MLRKVLKCKCSLRLELGKEVSEEELLEMIC